MAYLPGVFEEINARPFIVAASIVAGGFIGLVLVHELLSFIAPVFQYSIQFVILTSVGIGIYYTLMVNETIKR